MDSLELARFRDEWRAEVERRRTVPPEQHSQDKIEIPLPTPAVASKSDVVSSFPNAPRSAFQDSALACYRRAVDHERKGDLDDALRLYRIAFRKDANVDRQYHREEIILNSGEIIYPNNMSENNVVLVKDSDRMHITSVATQTIAKIISRFPDHLVFDREVKENGDVPFNILPDEILIKILSKLDPTSLERFAAVNRKARVFTLDSALWREFVFSVYQPPQVPSQATLDAAVERCLYDFRRVYIELPRVRTDGAYISVCHYVRSGMSENSWVNVNHLITYHRYLRFFPNGHVLSLRTNEEHPPSDIIPILKPNLRMKGLFFGRWTLISDTTIFITSLVEATGHLPISLDSELSEVVLSNNIRYVFSMSLNLRSRPLGRWNRLDITAFESFNVRSGDVVPVITKQERPFWFSKVRSY